MNIPTHDVGDHILHQVEVFMQGTEYGDEQMKTMMARELEQRLVKAENENRPLRVYCGFDPRTSDLHLGHTVPMRKLQQFQQFGHQVIFLIGNYTSLIGDPSDQDKLRPQLTFEDVHNNARTYAQQAFKVLDPAKTEIRHNADWLSKITFIELIKLAANFTVQQFLTRENFRTRWDKGDPVFLHETFYSLMQGYDAFMLDADVQVGGTDQLFNILTAARKVMQFYGKDPNIAIILGILPGTDGDIKMSKSLGNHIPLLSPADDMFGKIMSVPDRAMGHFFRLATTWSPEKIKTIEDGMSSGKIHPRDVKMELANDIVSTYHSETDALNARTRFIQVFREKEIPEDIESIQISTDQTILDLMYISKLVHSRAEGRRLVKQNGVRFNGEIVSDALLQIPGDGVLQVGKRRFVKVTLTEN